MQKYEWIGLREGSNFAYTKGEVPIYDVSCNNSLIISSLEKGIIKGINNHALIKTPWKHHIIPITKMDRIMEISEDIFKEGKIFYKKPTSISEIQNLKTLSEEEIKQKISYHYGISVKSINEINTKKGSHRVYEIFSEEGLKFMLKHYGKNLDLFNWQVSLLEGISSVPKIINLKDSKPFFSFKNSIYYLEEFANGNPSPSNKEFYFYLVGKNLALIHNEFNKKRISISRLEETLNKGGNFLSESNLISMQIDLMNHLKNNLFLEKTPIFYDQFRNLEGFPDQIIHGDLNKSNLIWKGNNPMIIDFETITFSKRIKEFIPALLFEGNLAVPRYIPGSLNELLDSYDFYSNKKLEEKEKIILPYLLKFSLIKSYIVYVIRRNLDDEKFKKQIEDNLKIIKEEQNVY